MRLTNILLISLICLISYYKFSKKPTMPIFSKTNNAIVIKPRQTKNITPRVLNRNTIKHSTTLNNYIDTDGRNTTGIRHNIKIGNKYYINGNLTSRKSSYSSREVSGRLSITKYW